MGAGAGGLSREACVQLTILDLVEVYGLLTAQLRPAI